MIKKASKTIIVLTVAMCGCIWLSACGTTDVTKAAEKNSENVEILSTGENAADVEGAFEDGEEVSKEPVKYEFSDEDWGRTLGDLTRDGEVGFEFMLSDGGYPRADSENIVSVEEIPVDYTMTFDELTNHGTAEYKYDAGDDVGYKTVYKAEEE